MMFGSEEEVQLCERGGETAGEEREAATTAARAEGEESTGQCMPMDFQSPIITILLQLSSLVVLWQREYYTLS